MRGQPYHPYTAHLSPCQQSGCQPCSQVGIGSSSHHHVSPHRQEQYCHPAAINTVITDTLTPPQSSSLTESVASMLALFSSRHWIASAFLFIAASRRGVRLYCSSKHSHHIQSDTPVPLHSSSLTLSFASMFALFSSRQLMASTWLKCAAVIRGVALV